MRVIDTDPVSIDEAQAAGVEAICGDGLAPQQFGDEAIVCFNLILHHLVGDSELRTRELQQSALTVWRGRNVRLFVNEYIYESWFGDLSGWLIFQITRSRILSALGKGVAWFLPSLRANTFGVGVRFRSRAAWREFFEEAGFIVAAEVRGRDEIVSLPRRLLMIKSIRKDSFLLEET